MTGKITVHQYKLWDTGNECFVKANRWGTPEGIARLTKGTGTIIEGSGVEVDASLVGRRDPGMTDIGFVPPK